MSGESASIPGYMSAWGTHWNTLVVADRFQGKTVVFIALLISGWINIAFLVSMAIRWREVGIVNLRQPQAQ